MKKLLAAFLLLSALPLFAANATPTAVTTITVASSTVTVNSTAHGLAVNQGFCLSAPANVCQVVVTSAANSFTFTQSGFTACASACGTVNPAPRVIVLTTDVPQQSRMVVHYLLWLTTQQPVAGPSISSWKASGVSLGASQAENNAIAAGWFIEKQGQLDVANGTAVATLQTLLLNAWTMEQQSQASNAQPGQWYGQVLDPAGWAQQ